MSLVVITEIETGIDELGSHGNSTGFDWKYVFFLFCVTKGKRKIKSRGEVAVFGVTGLVLFLSGILVFREKDVRYYGISSSVGDGKLKFLS